MLKKLSKHVQAALLVTLSINSLKAITYYISPTGNNNAAGTSQSTAWQSISKLNTINLMPGTIVLFEGGKVFQGSIVLDASDGNDISSPLLISSYGVGKATIQSGAAIGINAYNTKGLQIANLIIEGSGMSTNTTHGIILSTNIGGDIKLGNIKITNVEIRNYGLVGLCIYSSLGNTGFKDVLIDQVHIHHVRENGLLISGYTAPNHIGWSHENIIIRNTEVDNVPGYADPNVHRGSGIIMAQVDNGVIEKSVAHHNGSANIHCGGPGGIWVYDCNNITIQHCESYSNSSGTGCDGLGFDLDGGVVNSIMQYNYSHDNDGAGYLLGQYDNARPWKNNIVRYNISENDGRTNAGGITLFKGNNTTMNGCKIYNNTVYISPSPANNAVGAFTFVNWHTGITGIEVYNNIFQTSGDASLVDIPTGYDAYFAGNLYWSSTTNFKIQYHGVTYNNLGAWRSVSSNEKVGTLQTGLTADPLLTSVGNGGIVWPSPTYSLSAYMTPAISPANNSALDLNSLFAINSGTIDFYNSAIITSNVHSIGAYENPSTLVTAIKDENSTLQKISYYPNPVNMGGEIYFSGGEAPYILELLNLSGVSVSKEIVYNSAYHVTEGQIASGLYIIRIIDSKEQVISGKIIIR